MTAMEIEVVPRMLENRAFVDLCERMGFKPVAMKPRPPEAAKATKKRKLGKKGVIDWTLPIEFVDGTPAVAKPWRAEEATYMVELVGGEEFPPSVGALFPHSGKSYTSSQVIISENGRYWNSGKEPIVRNREVVEEEEEIDASIPQKVDWSKPIEFIDGTPAVVGLLEHSADREDGLPFTDDQQRLLFNGGNTYKEYGVALNRDGSYPSCPPRTWPIRNRKAKRKAPKAKATKIDWSKPIEFIDGTPAFVPTKTNPLTDRKRVEVEPGHADPAIMAGKGKSMHGGWWLFLDGRYGERGEPLIRNRGD